MKKKFKVLSNTANLKLKIHGDDLKELFANAISGMFESIEPECAKATQLQTRHITASAYDQESLLVSLLAEALYLSDVHHEVYERVHFDLFSPSEIKATLHGKEFTSLKAEIKAITYHELEIKKVSDHYEAIIIFDL